MHPNPTFRKTAADQDIAFLRDRSFGILTMNGEDTPMAAHIPFRLNEDASGVEAHLVRSNPIWRAIETPVTTKLMVSGGDAYVSPDWYGVDDQVPTWNYIAVHLTVRLYRLDQSKLRGILKRLSAQFEGRIEGKNPWTLGKMTPDVLEKMERQIVPIGMDILDLQSTWKLGQNKPDAARLGAADGMETAPIGAEVGQISYAMRKV
ncbi:MAG: FMN-binding negative transcriptional regulator [Planktomarina sp.]